MPQINGKEVGIIGYGLMGLTWRKNPPPQEQAFGTMRAALARGCNFWNGGEFYGPKDYNSLVLVERYFAKYPEDADKVVLSIKGAVGTSGHSIDGSPEGVRRSIDGALEQLKGRKKLDVFECARRDPNVPLEVTFGVMQREYIDKGLLGGISLSEVRASTIHEAVKVAKIVAVEVELSLSATDVLTNGVAAACAQHNIPLVAYSPLGRGLLTGKLKTVDDVPDHLKHMPRYQPENLSINLELVKQVEALAAKKGCTPAQLSVSWTVALSKRPGMPVIIPIPGGSTIERVNENSTLVDFTEAELDEIDATIAKIPIAGGRYPDYVPIEG